MPQVHIVGSSHKVHIMLRNTLSYDRAATSSAIDALGVLDRWAIAFAQGAEGVRFD